VIKANLIPKTGKWKSRDGSIELDVTVYYTKHSAIVLLERASDGESVETAICKDGDFAAWGTMSFGQNTSIGSTFLRGMSSEDSGSLLQVAVSLIGP
jgi:hypothetical protein